MRNLTLSVIAILITITAYGQQKQTRELPNFSYVTLGIDADVIITQGTTQKVVIEAKADDLEKIKTEVNGNKLKIRSYNNNSWFGDHFDYVKIYITLSKFTGASVSGSGSITNTNNLTGDEVDFGVSGSGNINLYIECNQLDTHISGSGNISAEGKTGKILLHISGSGDLDAVGMQAKELEAHISGSGSARVFVTQSIDAHISGSGRIRYKGNPDKILDKVSGSGSVRSL